MSKNEDVLRALRMERLRTLVKEAAGDNSLGIKEMPSGSFIIDATPEGITSMVLTLDGRFYITDLLSEET